MTDDVPAQIVEKFAITDEAVVNGALTGFYGSDAGEILAVCAGLGTTARPSTDLARITSG
jgi:hypothetical protein